MAQIALYAQINNFLGMAIDIVEDHAFAQRGVAQRQFCSVGHFKQLREQNTAEVDGVTALAANAVDFFAFAGVEAGKLFGQRFELFELYDFGIDGLEGGAVALDIGGFSEGAIGAGRCR